jgi:imidazolonepropionase-like amidohydrolase
MKRSPDLFAFCIFVLATGAIAPAQAKDLALVGGTVYTMDGPTLSAGVVLIRDGRILQVGRDIQVPPTAEVVDCTGRLVTPGFIESDTSMGLVEIDAEASTVDAQPRRKDPIRAGLTVIDAINRASPLIGVARRHGVTSVVTRPQGGLVSGQSAWLDLLEDRLVTEDAAIDGIALNARFGEEGAAFVEGSRASVFLRMREALDDARSFLESPRRYAQNDMRALSVSRVDLLALERLIRRDVPLVVEVSRASDILATIRLAREQNIRVVILGAEEGWRVADVLKEADVPVIVNPMINLPYRFESRWARADNAQRLIAAGVKTAFSVRSSHLASNLRFAAGNARRAGVGFDEALHAVTRVPAEIFGLQRRYGRLAAGAEANVVVWTGDPFEPSSFAERVIIGGEVQSTETRQTELSRRYLRTTRLPDLKQRAKTGS